MSIINGMPATAAARSPQDIQGLESPQPSAIGSGLKVCYGDPAAARELQDMLQKLAAMKSGAQSTVSSRNVSFQ